MTEEDIAEILGEFKYYYSYYTIKSPRYSKLLGNSPFYTRSRARKARLKRDIVALHNHGIFSTDFTQRLIDHFGLRAA